MSFEVSNVGPCKRAIKFSIPPEEVNEAFARTWRSAQQNVQLKGFRPGKVPRAVIEKKFGPQLLDDVKQNLINTAFRAAIQEHDLRVLRSPSVDTDAIKVERDQPVAFEVTVDVRPEFDLPVYRGIDVAAPQVIVNDLEVDNEIERMRSRFAEVEAVEGAVAAKGDYLQVDVDYQIDGAVVLHHDDAVVDMNGDTIDGLEAQGGAMLFVGKAVGATVSVSLVLPKTFEPKGYAGAKANLLTSVKAIKRVKLPDVNDEFAKKVGADDAADLRVKIKEEVGRAKGDQRNRYIEDRVIDELIKKTSFEVPVDLVEESVKEQLHRMEHMLVERGKSEAEARAQAASEADNVRQDRMRSLRSTFLLDRIAEAEKLTVSEQELESAVRMLAAVHNRPLQEVFDELVESGRLGGLRAQIMETKVRKLLREAARVADARTEPGKS